jgi:hypothetical protein
MSISFSHLSEELLALVPYAIGFLYSLFAGLLIWYTHKYLYYKFHKDQSTGWRSSYTGLVERGLYTGALLADYPAFVGIWLTLKSVSHWERFNGYFVDTGLSIAYGFAGNFITRNLICSQCEPAIALAVGLVVVHLILNIFIKSKAMKEERNV